MNEKQAWQMKNAITLDQTGVVARIDPAQALDRKPHTRQLASGPAATGTTYASKYQQRASWQIQQQAVCIKIG